MTFVKLWCPESYKRATAEERKRKCNGCGTKGLGGILVPDTMYGLNIKEACDIHDWMYAEGNTITHKNTADRVFRNNLLRIINARPHGRGIISFLRRRRARAYYKAVKHFGGPAFWSAGKLGQQTEVIPEENTYEIEVA